MSAAKPLDKEITYYLVHLNAQQKRAVLSVVKTFAQEGSDWWEEVEDAARESIERGLKQADQGRVRPHKEAMKKYKK